METGNLGDKVINKTPITRTREADGTVNDSVTLTTERMKETVQSVIQAGQTTARVVIPDTKDEVSKVEFILPKESTAELSKANVNLEIYTDNVKIQVPQSSLDNFLEDLYFRLVPIKEEQQRLEVESRARVENLVKLIANGNDVNVVARPMTIETNLQSRPVTLALPLRDVVLPTDEEERETFLADLVIFIEHSDGDKQLVKPEVVEYKSGQIGLEFGVEKFSTFTILNMEGWKEGDHKSYITGYVDGTFRPNANITRAEMATILARNLNFDESKTVASSYPDVSSTHWAKNPIEFIKGTGLMIGDNNGSFRPDAPITRGEMAAIAARYKKLATPSITNSKFQDVHRNHWAATSIEAVRKAGIVHGYQDGTYKPNGNLTRAEAVKIVNRLFDREPLYGVSSPSWPDVPTSHWAYTEIEEASQDHFYKSHFKI